MFNTLISEKKSLVSIVIANQFRNYFRHNIEMVFVTVWIQFATRIQSINATELV